MPMDLRIFMTGIPAQSPAKGWGAFDPGLDPGEEWAKGGVRLRGPSPWSGEGPERQTERSGWLRQRNAKEKPLPVQEIKLFRRLPPAPPQEGPFDRGIWA